MASYNLYKNPAYQNAVYLSRGRIPNPIFVTAYLTLFKAIGFWTAIQVLSAFQ